MAYGWLLAGAILWISSERRCDKSYNSFQLPVVSSQLRGVKTV